MPTLTPIRLILNQAVSSNCKEDDFTGGAEIAISLLETGGFLLRLIFGVFFFGLSVSLAVFARDDRASSRKSQIKPPSTAPIYVYDACENYDSSLSAPSSRILFPSRSQALASNCQGRVRAQGTRLSNEVTVIRPPPLPVRPIAVRPNPVAIRPPIVSGLPLTGLGAPIGPAPALVRPSTAIKNTELAGARPAAPIPSMPAPVGGSGSGGGEASMNLGQISGGHSAQGSTTDLQEWDGCDANSQIQGGYGGSTSAGKEGATDPGQSGGKDQGKGGCGKAMINPQFAAHMKKYFLKCVQDGAKAAGINGVQKAFINHMGVYNDRTTKAGAVSQHAYGRAMDIGSIDLLGSGGNSLGKIDTNVGTYSGQNQPMYDGFMRCWEESMKEGSTCEGEGKVGGLGHDQSKHPLKNADHNDHIHLSFANCKGSPYPVGGTK